MVDTALNTEALALHNQLREKHGCPPLTYDVKLAQTAQNWAEQLAQTKCMRHSDMETYGENLAYRGAWENAAISGEDAIKSWYAQGEFHDFNENFTYETSYFSQLVWKGSKNVGFGRAISEDGEAAYIVAHYFPKGNIRSVFSNNVPKVGSLSAANTAAGSIASTSNVRHSKLGSKKELKEREKAEKKARERAEKERKEREKQLRKEQKEREKQAKKDQRKTKSLSGI